MTATRTPLDDALTRFEAARVESKERKAAFYTTSGIERPTVEVASPDGALAAEYPGVYPFTRGIQPTMYRGRLWTMRQYAGFGTAAQSNARYRQLIDAGQSGLSVAFDLPTQMGIDADESRALGEVGKVGVSIGSIRDMQILLDGMPLDNVSTSMTINATATTLLALYCAVAEAKGVSLDALSGTIQNDILKEYIARGTYIYPPTPSLRLVTDTFAFCARAMPKWNPISISGYHIREAGATAAQELGFTLANAITYVEAARATGLQVDAFARQLSFFFNVHNDFLEEIAKFRAARRMWARIMRERFGAKDEKSMALRFHAQTAGSSLTAQQPMNNVVRVSLQAMAAVLGGAQSLHTNSWDEALALPTESSAKLALRTQQIIAYETMVTDCVDPLGGSYHLEHLTDQLESLAQEYISRIDDMGGMVVAIQKGYPQREIQDAAFRTQRAQEEGEQVVVGVNKFAETEVRPQGLSTVDESVAEQQRRGLAQVRRERSNERYTAAVDALRRAAARPDVNLVPLVIEAVKALATLGEISHALRSVFGEHHDDASLG